MNRTVKRLVIILIYLIIFGGIAFWIWQKNRPVPSCTDGKLNQNEESVDCGGVCAACVETIVAKPFQVVGVTMVVGGQDRYDVIAEIKNPNPLYGAENFIYEIILRDADGVEIERIQNTGFILPNQQKYVAQLNIPSANPPARAEIVIPTDQVEWVKFTSYEDPDFVINGKRFGKVENGGTNYAEAFGIVHNRSTFDFQRVNITVVIKDLDGKPLAVNKSFMGDFEGLRQRDFNLGWPYRFPGEMSSLDVQVDVDVYDSENFIKSYAPESEIIKPLR